jgi:hypothetical protein
MAKGMHGAEAGLLRIGSSGPKVILTTSAASADSGPQCQEGKFWKTWTFALAGVFTNYSVTLYGTLDAATAAGTAANWFQLPSPSTDADTGTVQNPLTATNQSMEYGSALLAVRAVATGIGQTGTVSVLVNATP